MNISESKILLRFINRPAMYIGDDSRTSVLGFITGYEIGTNGSCNISKCISKVLADIHSINTSSDGWPGQIARFSQKHDISWLASFQLLTLEVISIETHFDQEMRKELMIKVINLLSVIKNPKDFWYAYHSWHFQWKFVYELINKCCLDFFSNEIQSKLDEINYELENCVEISQGGYARPSINSYAIAPELCALLEKIAY